MLVVSVANVKGGVAKTTTAVTLAESLAYHHNCWVLVIDIDPQANSSVILLGPEKVCAAHNSSKAIDQYLATLAGNRHRRPISHYIHEKVGDLEFKSASSNGCLSLISSSPRLNFVEREFFVNNKKPFEGFVAIRNQIKSDIYGDLSSLQPLYDFVIVDTPPGLSIFSEAVLGISDFIIMPVVPDYVSTFGVPELMHLFKWNDIIPEAKTHHLFVLVTKFQAKLKPHANYCKRIFSGEFGRNFNFAIEQRDAIPAAASISLRERTFEDKYKDAANNLKDFSNLFLKTMHKEGIM